MATLDSAPGLLAVLAVPGITLRIVLRSCSSSCSTSSSSSCSFSYSSLPPQPTCTRKKHMHAHVHIGSSPSSPVQSLTFTSWFFSLCSHPPKPPNPLIQPQLPPASPVSFLGLLFAPPPKPTDSPVFGLRLGCLLTGPSSDLSSGQTPPTIGSGGGSYQVATPRPLSSRASPVGRTCSLTGFGFVVSGRTATLFFPF